MDQRVKIEIKGRDSFWGRAFHVEWQDQYPERSLKEAGGNTYAADPGWLEDIRRVAAQTHCEIILAPQNPDRRDWLGSLLPLGKRKGR